MQTARQWNIAAPSDGVEVLASRLRTHRLLAQILLNRGLQEPGACDDFLRPSLKCLHDPATIPNLTRASERIARAIRDQEKIVVYGDYDVDGITATTILWHAIRLLGGTVDYYIPHRVEEGYGLNADAIAQICTDGARLIVSVDCGVTAVEPAQIARDRGVDLIITDHHEWRSQPADPSTPEIAGAPLLPDCYAVVHPRLPVPSGETYLNPFLCGAGVAFKLAWGIGRAVSGGGRVDAAFRDFLLNATALAGLGTIADVVPLVGENRIIAHKGLSGLRASKLAGIQALIASAGLEGQNLDSFHVGFLLAPRLNASGRMGHARLAVEMLTSADEPRALEIATYLEEQNRHRQAIEKQVLEQALQQVADNGWATDASRVLVVGGQGWHPGVIGIVASRLVDRFHRPTLVVTLNDGHGQGSGRSVAGFHLARALDACDGHLEGHGGHEMAAGLKVTTAKFPAFREAFITHAAQVITPEMLVPQLSLDAVAELREVTPALVNDLSRLGPFGHGNRRPLFACRGVSVVAPARRVGKTGNHLQLQVRQGTHVMRCIAFGHGDLVDRLSTGVNVDLAVEPSLNEYNGYVNVQLEVKDLQFS